MVFVDKHRITGGGIMAHFAKVENDVVVEVVVIGNEDCDNLPFPDSEPIGQAFIASLGLQGTWLQTSYSGSFRVIYAGIGYTFDPTVGDYGAFIEPPIAPIT
jgi:hypothetical protein